jgi:hypothetical protein
MIFSGTMLLQHKAASTTKAASPRRHGNGLQDLFVLAKEPKACALLDDGYSP